MKPRVGSRQPSATRPRLMSQNSGSVCALPASGPRMQGHCGGSAAYRRLGHATSGPCSLLHLPTCPRAIPLAPTVPVGASDGCVDWPVELEPGARGGAGTSMCDRSDAKCLRNNMAGMTWKKRSNMHGRSGCSVALRYSATGHGKGSVVSRSQMLMAICGWWCRLAGASLSVPVPTLVQFQCSSSRSEGILKEMSATRTSW